MAPSPIAAAPAASSGVFAFFAASPIPFAVFCAPDAIALRADSTAPLAPFADCRRVAERGDRLDARELDVRELDARFVVVDFRAADFALDRAFVGFPLELRVDVLRRCGALRVFVSAIRPSLVSAIRRSSPGSALANPPTRRRPN